MNVPYLIEGRRVRYSFQGIKPAHGKEPQVSNLPDVFHHDLFPEINDVVEFRGHRYVFFEQFDLPTLAQLKRVREAAPGWSLITWGWWDGQADIADMDIEGITFDSDNLEDLAELTPEGQLPIFDLNPAGLPSGDRVAQPIRQVEDRTELYSEGMGYGLVAVECPNWMTVAVCEWHGSDNVAEADSLAMVLRVWQERWGVEVLAFGAEEGDADLLVRLPQAPENREEMLTAMAVASDGVSFYEDDELGLLVNLWWD